MKKRRLSLSGRAWLSLTLPPVAWFLFEQGLSALLHARCQDNALGVGWGAVSLAACVLAAWIAWPLHVHREHLANPWLASLGLMIAPIFALAIAYQTLALLLVPPCLG